VRPNIPRKGVEGSERKLYFFSEGGQGGGRKEGGADRFNICESLSMVDARNLPVLLRGLGNEVRTFLSRPVRYQEGRASSTGEESGRS